MPAQLDIEEHMVPFVNNECRLGAMLGPFNDLPFFPWVQISPIMTHLKKESSEKHIIIDLSFPIGPKLGKVVFKERFSHSLCLHSPP